MYFAKFLRNFVFWYSVEKVFMVSIGFNNESIALMVAVYSTMSVLMEIPSGILADRWSRKGVLMLASLSLSISSLIGALSYNVPVYLICAIFWGFFDALASGTDEAIIYDTLVEEQGNGDNYEKEYGIYQAFGGVSLFVAGIAGGFIGEYIGLRETFLFAVPILVIASIVVLRYREPKFHKQAAETHLFQHIRDTFGAVFRNPNLLWILITLFTIGLANGLIGEMNQLWLIAVNAPILFFGVVAASVNATWGFGGLFARFFKTRKSIVVAILAVLASSIMLILVRNYYLLLLSFVVFMLCANAVFIAKTAQMHRQLPSRVRAGASSAANTIARLINVPLVVFFGWIAGQYSVFAAAWILFALVCMALLSELSARVRPTKSL